jgi:hypothetical protein
VLLLPFQRCSWVESGSIAANSEKFLTCIELIRIGIDSFMHSILLLDPHNLQGSDPQDLGKLEVGDAQIKCFQYTEAMLP